MKRTLYTLLLLFLSLFGITSLSAQNTIKGVLLDDSKGEAIPFAQVYLDGTNHWSSTDINGYFVINKIPDYKDDVRFFLFHVFEVTGKSPGIKGGTYM